MPSLQILKGTNEGAVIPLNGDRCVLGRNPDCQVNLPATSVSREHAQIVRIQGHYYIEDLKSRNKTFLNNQEVTVRTQLKHNDRIRICDFIAVFLDGTSDLPAIPAESEEPEESSSTVEAMLSSHLLLDTQPAEKLRGLLEISSSLTQTLDLDALLPKIVDCLFHLFRQADRCFLIQADEGNTKLMPRVVRTRRAHEETTARFSRSIVRRCLETAQAFLSDDASRDERVQLSQSVVDFRIRSVMCVPLRRADGKAFGVIQLDTQDRSKKFNQEDLKLLWGVADQASIALENARMHEEAVEQERLNRDLELAHQVQLSFLPARLPQVRDYELFAHYQPAQAVGGDYYGFIPLPDGRLAVTVGDVAGKGISAALLMAKLSSELRFCLLAETEVGRAISKLNDLLYEFTSPLDRFITLAAAVLDPARHMATLVNAGHLSPILIRSGQAPVDIVPKNVAGVPLGIMEGFAYDTCQLVFQPSDVLLLFSDGVTDALDVRNHDFGMKGIHQVLAAGTARAPGLGERLVRAVQQHAAGREPNDDVTLVCLGRAG